MSYAAVRLSLAALMVGRSPDPCQAALCLAQAALAASAPGFCMPLLHHRIVVMCQTAVARRPDGSPAKDSTAHETLRP